MRAAIQNADPRQRPTPPARAATEATPYTQYTSSSTRDPASSSLGQQYIPRTSSLDPDDYARRKAYPPERLFPPSQLGSISESAEAPSSTKQHKVRKNLLGGFRRVANAVKSAAGNRQPEGLAKTHSISGHEHRGSRILSHQNSPRPIVNHHPFASAGEPLAFRPQPDGSQSARPQQQHFSIYPATAQQLGAMSRHNMSMTSLDAYAQGTTGPASSSASSASRPLTPGSRQRSFTHQSRTQSPPNNSGSFYVSSQGSLERGVPAALSSRKAATILVANTSTNTSSMSSIGSDARPRNNAFLGVQKLPSAISYDFGHLPSRYPMVSPVKPVSPLSPIVTSDEDSTTMDARILSNNVPQINLYPTRSRSMTIPSKDDSDGDARVPAISPRLPRKTSVPQTSMAQRVALLSANSPASSEDDVINLPSFEPLMDGSIGRSAGDIIHKQAVHNISSTDLNVYKRTDASRHDQQQIQQQQQQSHYLHNVRSPLSLASSAGSLSRNTRSTGSLASRSIASAASSEDLLTAVPLSRILYTSYANGAGSAPQPSSPVGPTTRFSMADPPYQLAIDPNYMNMMEEAEKRQQELEQATVRSKNRDSERIDIYDMLVQGPNGYVLAGTQQDTGGADGNYSNDVSRVPENDSGVRVDNHLKVKTSQMAATPAASTIPQALLGQDLAMAGGSSLSIQTHGSVSESQVSMVTSAEGGGGGGGFNPGSPTSPFSFNHSRFSLINQDGSLNLASFDFNQLDGYQKRLSSFGSMGSPPPPQQQPSPPNLQRSESSRIVDRLTRKTNSNSNDGSSSGWFWSALNSDSPPSHAQPSSQSVQSPTRTRSLAVAAASLTPASIEGIGGVGQKQNRLVRKVRNNQQQLETQAAAAATTSFSKSNTDLGMWHDARDARDARNSLDNQAGRPSASFSIHDRSNSVGTSNSSTNASNAVVAPRTSDSSIGSNTSSSNNNRRQFHPHYTSLHTSAAAHRGIRQAGDNNASVDSPGYSGARQPQPYAAATAMGPRNRFPIILSAESPTSNPGRGRQRMRLMTIPRNYVPFDMIHSKMPASMSLENALTLIEGTAHDSAAGGALAASGAAARQHSRHRGRLHKRSASALTTSELDDIMVRTVEVCHSIQMAIKVQQSTDSGLGSWVCGVLRQPSGSKQKPTSDDSRAREATPDDALSLSSDNGSTTTSTPTAPESENQRDHHSPSLNGGRSVDITTNGSANASGDFLWSSDPELAPSSSHHRLPQSDAAEQKPSQAPAFRRRDTTTTSSGSKRSSCTSISSQPNDDDDIVGRMLRRSNSSYSSRRSNASDSASGVELSDPVKTYTFA
ncbi:hypothetical protein LPJ81_000099 [Coemansia sp. IMI 209127]|nr:hypothetical protein LPJ81_000099 [Coemansia sp. IMI 209127]